MTEKHKVLQLIDNCGVHAGQTWRHWKGGIYTITALPIDEESMKPRVDYAGADGIVWSRTLEKFLENTTNGQRFTLVSDDIDRSHPAHRAERRDLTTKKED